jgi:hypothetical protein
MPRVKRIARIIGYSETPETYIDIIAAIQRQLQPDKIEIIFIDSEQMPGMPEKGKQQSAFAHEIHNSIDKISATYDAYKACGGVQISIESARRDQLNSLLEGVLAVDVTAAPKDLAINTISNSLRFGGPPIYYIKWLTKFSGKRNRIGVDPYHYEDLTKLDEARALSKSYRIQSITLLTLILMVAVLAMIAVASSWYPFLVVFKDVLSVISVVAGFAGLIIAIYQTGLREGMTRRS